MNKETNIVKDSLLDLKQIQDFLKEGSGNILKNVVGDVVKNFLTEAAYEIEDGEDDKKDIEGLEDAEPAEDSIDDVEIEEPKTDDVDIDIDVDGAETEPEIGSGEEDDFDFDQFKSDDGEYDLTNADTDQLIKVFKRIDTSDNVIVTDLGNGKIELEDNDAGTEYMIDTNQSTDVDPEIEIDLDEPTVTEGKHSRYEGEKDLTEDAEVGAGEEGEGMVDEKSMTVSTGANGRAGVLSQTRAEYAPGDHKRSGAQLVINKESKEVKALKLAYNEKINKLNEQHKSFKKATDEEMIQLKGALGTFVKTIKENAVLNNSLGKFVKLIIENATTKSEKANILNKFTEIKSVEDGNKLYESIKKELNGKVTTNPMIDKQFGAEGSKSINEQVIYESQDLIKMQNMMKFMDKY